MDHEDIFANRRARIYLLLLSAGTALIIIIIVF